MMRRSRARPARGYLLLDAAAASGVLVLALSLTLALVSGLAAIRRSVDRRQIALHAASNALERLVSDWDSREDRDSDQQGMLDETARRLLPGAHLTTTVHESEPDSPPRLVRLTVELHWTGPSGRDEAPVRLTTWATARPRRSEEAPR
jgi:hypothetical protein